ncbi:hypothetical protein [Halobaculum sp. MBLA0143]|uniref:hypothetical protein n=1 Tax=Halobaculum sp. MBLA0143 TaxID=3079933 RepID=UPI003526B7F9
MLRAVGATGVGLTTIGEATATDDGVRIDTIKHRGETLKSKLVPKEWYQHETRVDAVAGALRQQYEDIKTVDGVGLTGTDRTVAGKRVTRPIIYTSESASAVSVPSKRDGISIEQRETPDLRLDTCYDQDYDNVPGGVQVETGVPFSVACRVINSDGEPRLMTCAHGFKQCEGSIKGDELTQSDRLIGGVEDWSVGQDWATVSLSASSPINGFDPGVVDTQRDVLGYVTENGIKDLISTGETVYHRGRKTCAQSGQVKETGFVFSNCEGTPQEDYGKYIRMSTYTESGDSGGIHYKRYKVDGKEYASVIAPHHGSSNYGSYGCPAYRIHNNHGFDFGQ